MKRLLIAALLLTSLCSVALAQDPFIGIYAAALGLLCNANVTQYVSVPVYLIAILPPEIPGITAAEFRIDNLPTSAMALATYNWNTPLVIGNADYGIALAFSPSLPGPLAPLGSISFFPLTDWPWDWRVEVMASNDSGNLVVVDLDYNEVPCEPGHWLTFNCTGALPGGCDCYPPIAVEDATWGQIKALY